MSGDCQQAPESGADGWLRFISILLVVLKMTTEKVLEEFIDLSVKILDVKHIEAQARTALLKQHLIELLEKHGIKKEMSLLSSSRQSTGCKL